MKTLNQNINDYLLYCKLQKRLDSKTIKAYKIDLTQFYESFPKIAIDCINLSNLEYYIGNLHKSFKPKTVKRKIASIKAFFHYLEYRDIITNNPFNKLQVKFREPVVLPKTIPLNTVELLLSTVYTKWKSSISVYQRRNALRDIATLELLFATGIRISELCSLQVNDVNLYEGTILINGKGSKERLVQIGNQDVVSILTEYKNIYKNEINICNYFFVNQAGRPLSDQTVRRMINKYTTIASIDLHITPHMFRHTFATSLLDADVDIRYIQEFLGHSSINTTEIYTHVSTNKQKNILSTKHPRINFNIKK